MNSLIRQTALATLGSALIGSFAFAAEEQFREVSFETSDSGRVFANVYGEGEHGVVLAHGAVFDKESWSEQATQLANDGFRVLAIDFRGYGKSRAGSNRGDLHLDVLAAVKYLRENGVKRVSVVGGSMGGGAAARASAQSSKGDIDDLILLAHAPIDTPQELKGRKLFIVSKGDGLVSAIRKQHAAAPEPKELVVMKGAAHAQHIFKTELGEVLMNHIKRALRHQD